MQSVYGHYLDHSLCSLGHRSDPGRRSDPCPGVGRPGIHPGIRPGTGPNRNDPDTLEETGHIVPFSPTLSRESKHASILVLTKTNHLIFQSGRIGAVWNSQYLICWDSNLGGDICGKSLPCSTVNF